MQMNKLFLFAVMTVLLSPIAFAATTVFNDTFDRANGADIGPYWRENAAPNNNWNISNNNLYANATRAIVENEFNISTGINAKAFQLINGWGTVGAGLEWDWNLSSTKAGYVTFRFTNSSRLTSPAGGAQCADVPFSTGDWIWMEVNTRQVHWYKNSTQADTIICTPANATGARKDKLDSNANPSNMRIDNYCYASSFTDCLPLAGTPSTTYTFTSNINWTAPYTGTIVVHVWGAGGGGGGVGLNNGAGSAGGGGGAYARKSINVTAGQVFNITVGVGGTDGNSGAPRRGGNGFPSWFNDSTTVYAQGGVGGGDGSPGGLGGNATQSIGDVKYSGGNGSSGTTGFSGGGGAAGNANIGNNASTSVGGAGSSPYGGAGAYGLTADGGGVNGFSVGGGGSGGFCDASCSGNNGGQGAAGMVIVEYASIPSFGLFSITAKNNVTDAFLTSFSANITINNTLQSYSTTNGTIITNLSTNAGRVNVTVYATNYLNNVSINYNTSAALEAKLNPYTQITIRDQYDNAAVTTAQINYSGIVYSANSTGDILLPVNTSTFNITVTSANYFNKTYLNNPQNTNVNAYIFQVQVTFTATEIISGNPVSGYTVTADNGKNTNGTSLYLRAGTHNLTWNRTSWYSNTTAFTYAALSNTTSNFGVFSHILNLTARNNITGANLTNFTVTITSNEYVYSTTLSTTNGTIFLPITNGTYVITASAIDFSTSAFNSTVNVTGITNQTLSMFPQPSSVYIYIYDESTNLLINTTTINVTVSGTLGDITNTTTTGISYVSNLTMGTYSVKLAGGSYSLRTYTVTLGANDTVILYAYLPLNALTTTFDLLDVSTGNTISGLSVVAQRSIGGVFTTVDSKISDISGTAQFNYIAGVRYQFIISGTSSTGTTYQTNSFILDPIVYNSGTTPTGYQVKMTPTNIYDNSADYDQVQIFYSPFVYYSPATNNFSITFISPTGTLTQYDYTLTYPGGSVSGSGNSLTGSTLLNTVNLSNALFTDTVNLTYTYSSTLFNGTKTFKTTFPILVQSTTPNTFAALCTTDYGLGDLEKAGITVIGTGLLASAGQVAGGTLGTGVMVVLGLFAAYKMCIITLWGVALALMTGLVIIILGDNFL